jgi:hypothetical protein
MITYFHLGRPDSERLLADIITASASFERSPCPITREHLDGNRRLSNLALKVKHNDRDEKMIWTWGGECLVHEQLAEAFHRRGITGFTLRPATLRFRDGFLSNDYSELVVTGWAGVARPESGIRVLKSCPACRWKTYSVLKNAEQLIDWDHWTKDDCFIVWPLPSSPWCNPRNSGDTD